MAGALDETLVVRISKGMLDHTTYQATDHYVQVMDGPVKAMLNQHEARIIHCASA